MPQRHFGVLRFRCVRLWRPGELATRSIDRHRLACLEVHHRERAIVLRVADERARRNVLGIARLGDVVRHVRDAWPPRRSTMSMNTCVPSGESCRSVADCRSASSNFGSACALSFSSAFFFFSASTRVCSISFASSDLMNFWLSVSRGSRLRGCTSVSCAISPLSIGTTNRLLSRVKVTADSWRAQRGFASFAGRARNLAARAADRIQQHDVAAIDEQHPPVRLVPAAVDRRRAAPFLVRQLARRAAVARRPPRSTPRRRRPCAIRSRGATESPDQRSPVGG